MHTQIHIYKHIRTYTYTKTYVNARTYTYTNAHAHKHTYIQTHMQTCAYIQTHTRTHKYAYIQTQTYIHTNTHTHAHISTYKHTHDHTDTHTVQNPLEVETHIETRFLPIAPLRFSERCQWLSGAPCYTRLNNSLTNNQHWISVARSEMARAKCFRCVFLLSAK